MGQLLLWVSLVVCALSLFFSLDSLKPFRSQLGELVPDSVVQFFELEETKHEPTVRPMSFSIKPVRVFTKQELSKYTGENGGSVYIAILGCVFDVSRGRRHYGPGGGYSFFAGRDASRAFVTGDFDNEKSLTDDISGFESSQILSLEEWKDFYLRDYTYVGKVDGNFYTAEGKPTAELKRYEENLKKANKKKKAEEDMRRIFPPCNSQWSQGGHVQVWCTNLSGGIQRNWVGVPRQYFEPGKTQAKPRCVCVRNTGPPYDAVDSNSQHNNRGDLDNPHLKLYDGCDPNADSCMYIRASD